MDYLERRNDEKKDDSGQTPFLFFIALGLGIVFTNLWVILGLRYCCRQRRRRQELEAAGYAVTPSDLEHGRSDEWAFYLNPLFAGRPSYYRRLDRRLVTRDDLDRRFPVVKYKEWTLEREREGLSADGGISLDAAVANGRANDHEEEEVNEKEHVTSTSREEDVSARPSASVQLPPTPPESPKPEAGAGEADCTPGDLCSVCLDVLEPENDVRVLTCEHVFHDECITRWLTTRRGLCPLCKRDYCPRPLYTPPARRATTTATTTNNNDTTNTTNQNASNNDNTTNNETTTTHDNDDTIQRPEPAHHRDDDNEHRHRRRWFIRRQPSNRRLITMAPFI